MLAVGLHVRSSLFPHWLCVASSSLSVTQRAVSSAAATDVARCRRKGPEFYLLFDQARPTLPRMDCIRSPWDVRDWRPCFRTAVLNTAVPLLGVTISITACFINVRYSHSDIDSLDQAAQYDLGSPSTPMQHVLHTESSVILHEASSIVHEAIAYEASLPTTGHAWMDIGVCVFLVCLHAIGAWVSTYEWNVTWGL